MEIKDRIVMTTDAETMQEGDTGRIVKKHKIIPRWWLIKFDKRPKGLRIRKQKLWMYDAWFEKRKEGTK